MQGGIPWPIRALMAGLIMAFCACSLAVVAVANYSYGLTQGTPGIVDWYFVQFNAQELTALGYLCFDGLAPVLFLVAQWRYRDGHYLAAFFAVVAASFFAFVSFTNLMGHMAVESAAAQAGRHDKSDGRALIEAKLKDLELRRSWLIVSRSPASILADIEARKADPIFRRADRTNGCQTDAITREDSLAFCREYRKLESQLDDARKAAALDDEITRTRIALANTPRVIVSDGLSTIQELIGLPANTAEKYKPILMTAAFFIAATFALTFASWAWGYSQKKEPRGDDLTKVVQPSPRGLEVVPPPSEGDLESVPHCTDLATEPREALPAPEPVPATPIPLEPAPQPRRAPAPVQTPIGQARDVPRIAKAKGRQLQVVPRTPEELVEQWLRTVAPGQHLFSELQDSIDAYCKDRRLELIKRRTLGPMLQKMGYAMKRGAGGKNFYTIQGEGKAEAANG